MLKVLFVVNYFESSKRKITVDKSYLYPLGILSIATRLEECGHFVKVIDLNVEDVSASLVVDTVKEMQPHMVCLSAYTENVKSVMKLAKIIKQINSDIKVLLGGPHPTLQPLDCIKSKYVDYLGVSEGESTILELAEALDHNEEVIKISDIRSLYYRRGKEIVQNEALPFMKNLDIYPIIKRDYVNPIYNNILNITTSRGCPAHCIYCSASSLSGARYRVRDVNNVYMECMYFAILYADQPKEIYIVDDTFTAIKKRVNVFIDLINHYETTFPWSCESRIDVMSEELIHRMAKSGCKDVQFGIESGSQEVLDKIRKNIDLDKARQIIQYTYESGMIVTLSFMLGHFCDTPDTMGQTRDFIKEMYEKYGEKANMAVSYNTPFPGTWQYEHREEIGLNLIDDKYENMTLTNPIVETNRFTTKMLKSFYNECMQYTAEGKLIKMES